MGRVKGCGAVSWAWLLWVVVCGCEQRADVEHPRVYEREGLSFQYPGNWKANGQVLEGGLQHVELESPGDAIIFVQRFPFEGEELLDVEAYSRELSMSAKEEMPIGELHPGKISQITFKRSDQVELKGHRESFEVSLLGQRVPHERVIFGYPPGLPRVVVVCQIATEDMKKARPACDLALQTVKIE